MDKKYEKYYQTIDRSAGHVEEEYLDDKRWTVDGDLMLDGCPDADEMSEEEREELICEMLREQYEDDYFDGDWDRLVADLRLVDEMAIKRQEDFQRLARMMSDQFLAFEEITRVVMFGKCARKTLAREKPKHSRRLRKAGVKPLHRIGHLNLGLWLSSFERLPEIHRVRSKVIGGVQKSREMNINTHEITLNVFAAETSEFLGVICEYRDCPKKGNAECLREDCGRFPHLRTIPDYEFDDRQLESDKIEVLFQR